MSPYENLLAHIDEHKYLRGAHKGDAPLDAKRRRRTEDRVVRGDGYAAAVRYGTEILRAYPDGRVVLHCGGWGSALTTRLAMNEALRITDLVSSVGWMHGVQFRGISQLALGVWRYYDGMELLPSPDGYKPTTLRSYRGRRKDKARTKEFREGIRTSGFDALFPMLYANATPEDRTFALDNQRVHVSLKTLTDPRWAEQWPGVVAYYKFSNYAYELDPTTGKGVRVWESRSLTQTRAALVKDATAHMTETYDTDIFEL